jgi:hypothetical protein
MADAVARFRPGDAVLFTDVAGRDRQATVLQPPVRLGQVWFVALDLDGGLFLADRVRHPGEPPPKPPRRAPAYAGIGSRRTPDEILALMRQAAGHLATRGYTLRSGAAPGADTAFEDGARIAGGRCAIFLPWRGYQSRSASQSEGVFAFDQAEIHQQALAIAAEHHPAWDRLGQGPRKLMARNAHQVLGPTLDDPVRFVLCWAPKPRVLDGRVVDCDGGTGLAVRLAAARKIPVYNLAIEEYRARVVDMLGERADAHRAPMQT